MLIAASAGFVMFGPIGREIFGAFFWIFLTVIAGAGMIGISTALNALSTHGACTVVFVVVAAVVVVLIASTETLEKLGWLSWAGVACIMVSVITLVAAVSRQDRPSAAPKTGPWDKDVIVVGHPSFVDAINAVATVFFSFAGSPYYFNVAAELRNPNHYNRSIMASSIFTTSTYLIIGGCVVRAALTSGSLTYHYCGQYISSPALGSAGVLMKKVCYGIAMPGLIVSAVLNTHMAAKYVFVRLLRNSRHLTEKTKRHYVVWVGCIVTNGTLSFVIAESIPIFNDIISLTGAILGTPCAYTMPLMMWFYAKKDDLKERRTPLLLVLALVNALLFLCSVFIAIGGTYTSVVSIRDNLKKGDVGGVFSCADNSNSV